MIWLRKHQLVLELLEEHGPLTGLGLIDASRGQLARGTVYWWLSDLVDAGRVAGPDADRLYRITQDGRRALAGSDLLVPLEA